MPANTCPSCGGPPPRSGQLLCKTCWHSVPAALQRAVYSTWRAVGRARDRLFADPTTPSPHTSAFREASQKYREAADAATNAARNAISPLKQIQR